MMSFLSSLGLMLGVGEASKLLDDAFMKDERKVSRVVKEIIAAANRKGSEELSKAQRAIENIPMLSSSPSIQDELRRIRSKAQSNLINVERKVNDIQSDANQLENELARSESRSVFSKFKDRINNHSDVLDSARNFANKNAINYESIEKSVKEDK